MMSNIKVGDKVRFLNSTGGGVVRSFKGKDQVLVEDEDGFEVPALIRECVVVGDSEMQVHSSRRSPLPSVTQAAVPQPKKPEPQPEVEKVTETIEGERLNIYLAYLPIEPAKVMQGSGYETYFINDSNYYLFFNRLDSYIFICKSRVYRLIFVSKQKISEYENTANECKKLLESVVWMDQKNMFWQDG